VRQRAKKEPMLRFEREANRAHWLQPPCLGNGELRWFVERTGEGRAHLAVEKKAQCADSARGIYECGRKAVSTRCRVVAQGKKKAVNPHRMVAPLVGFPL